VKICIMTNSEILHPTRAAELLERQEKLQTEAQAVLAALDLYRLLSTVGSVRQIGSSALGLMVWRDIDLAVSSPGLSIERAYDAMRPLFTHAGVKQVRYFNESGNFKPDEIDARYFFMIYYDFHGQAEWKIDISFWLGEGMHPEPLHDALAKQLAAETRLAILWIKDTWVQLPTYRNSVYSTDIYEAVLQYGVRTPGEFERYLAERDKPARANGGHV